MLILLRLGLELISGLVCGLIQPIEKPVRRARTNKLRGVFAAAPATGP